MANVRKIEAAAPAVPGKKRVAAYARVSAESEQMRHSLSAQVSYYSALIQATPGWEYAGVYADCGISGTGTKRRDGFNRLMADCGAGKIDIVLAKSISRFARNTVDLLKAVRHLKDIGVEVRFEREGISTMGGEGELMLTILASFAQEESEATRQNVLWGIRKRFGEGEPNGHKRCLGYAWDGGGYAVVPEEADAVRRIFDMYISGMSSVQIAKALDADGVTGINGNPVTDYNVRFVLDNVSYTGSLLLQKRYSPSAGKSSRNRGGAEQYLVEGDHEPIIDSATFKKAQAMRREKAEALPEKNASVFSGLMRCGYCGHAVCRRNVKKKPVWYCNAVDKKGTSACGCGRRLPEAELEEAAADVLGCGYADAIRGDVDRITVYDDRLEFAMAGGRPVTWKRRFSPSPHGRGCFSGKVFCGGCGGKLVRESSSRKGYAAWVCRCGRPPLNEKELRRAATETVGDDMEFYVSTDRVCVFEDRLEFFMKDGEVRTWQRR